MKISFSWNESTNIFSAWFYKIKEAICSLFPDVDKLIPALTFFSSKHLSNPHLQDYCTPDLTLPPQPFGQGGGIWIYAALYYADNSDKSYDISKNCCTSHTNCNIKELKTMKEIHTPRYELTGLDSCKCILHDYVYNQTMVKYVTFFTHMCLIFNYISSWILFIKHVFLIINVYILFKTLAVGHICVVLVCLHYNKILSSLKKMYFKYTDISAPQICYIISVNCGRECYTGKMTLPNSLENVVCCVHLTNCWSKPTVCSIKFTKNKWMITCYFTFNLHGHFTITTNKE